MFKRVEIDNEESIKELIRVAFQTDLEVGGAWGYTKELATHIGKEASVSVAQTEFTLATMRAFLEMNMTLSETERYGAINLNELSRESVDGYEKVTYEISAMKELEYNAFITEYKENLEKEDFDLAGHFLKRKEATLKREVTHWFKIEG